MHASHTNVLLARQDDLFFVVLNLQMQTTCNSQIAHKFIKQEHGSFFCSVYANISARLTFLVPTGVFAASCLSFILIQPDLLQFVTLYQNVTMMNVCTSSCWGHESC